VAIKDIQVYLDRKVKERALARIGYFANKRGHPVDYRSLLHWFVECSRTNPVDLRPTPRRERIEELRAIQEEGYDGVSLIEDEAKAAAHLLRLHTTVTQYLEQLTKRGRIEFEEFKLSPSIMIPRFLPGVGATSAYKHTHYGSKFVEPSQGEGLRYLFFLALRAASDRLRQCLHCATIFVQTRPKQRFCTRLHQQVASMRALRALEKARKQRKTTRPRHAHATDHTRATTGGKHGTKKHR
jgi:hypothetical protein